MPLAVCQKRPTPVSKETDLTVKRPASTGVSVGYAADPRHVLNRHVRNPPLLLLA